MLLLCQFPEGDVAEPSVNVPENLRSPQVASDDDDSNIAVQVAGDVIQYGMVRFQLDQSYVIMVMCNDSLSTTEVIMHEGKYASTSICLSG